MSEKISGKIDVKGYQTKYDFGDTFWIMVNSAPVQLTVIEIEITVTLTSFNVQYNTQRTVDKDTRRRTEKELDSFPRTKEELCKQIFQI